MCFYLHSIGQRKLGPPPSIAPQSMLVRAVTYGPSAWYPDLRATHHVQMSQNIPQVPFGQPEQVVLG